MKTKYQQLRAKMNVILTNQVKWDLFKIQSKGLRHIKSSIQVTYNPEETPWMSDYFNME